MCCDGNVVLEGEEDEEDGSSLMVEKLLLDCFGAAILKIENEDSEKVRVGRYIFHRYM